MPAAVPSIPSATSSPSLADADPKRWPRRSSAAWPRVGPQDKTPKLTEAIDKDLLASGSPSAAGQRAVLVQLATSWGSKGFEKIAAEIPRLLLAKIADDKLAADGTDRRRPRTARVPAGRQETRARSLLELITPRSPPELAAGLLRALQLSEVPQTGQLIVDKLPGLTPAARSAASASAEPAGMDAGPARAGREGQVPADRAVARSEAGSGRPSQRRRQTPGRRPAQEGRRAAQRRPAEGGRGAAADHQGKGDAAAGKLVFKNVCAKCHVHSGEGTRIGPDLTGMAVHTKEHLLIDIIDPSRSVEGNFRIYQVTTTKGRFYTGMLASESKTAIELFDAEGKKLTILRESIDEMTALDQIADARRLREAAQAARTDRPARVPDAARQISAVAAGQGGHRRQHARHVLQRGSRRSNG